MSNQSDTLAKALKKNSKSLKQFIIFGLVGVSNTIVDVVLYSVLLHFSVYYLLANVISYGAGMLNSYIWNNTITFRSKQSMSQVDWSKIVRFVIWNVSMLACSSLFIYVLTELATVHAIVSKIIATCIILVVQFIGNKIWVFKQ